MRENQQAIRTPLLHILGFLFASFLACVSSALAQSAPAQSQTSQSPRAPDYSQEPYVVEQYYSRVRFENDGTGERDLTVRIRVQSEAGVQQLGELMFEYNSANERMDVNYVRVRKADGSIVTASANAVKDLTAPIARDAPVYTDTHEKRITVPALRPGETLEYNIATRQVTPLAPGQFWLEHNFLEGAIVLDERFEVNVPRSRAVKIKTQPGFDPVIGEEGDRRIYRWTHAIRQRPPEEAVKKETKKEPKPPAVQLTTFSSWDEVGRWYAQLERDRITPSPEVRAKAAELIQGRASDLEKIAALYDYVAKNVRYVSLSFGTGRYQPHAAAEVFSNQYGDCKDKHTLLAAMLASAGLPADAALISVLRKIDPDLPSPAQFDHVITAVSLGNDLIWMDTTTEVAPFRLLIPNLRKKEALLVPPEGTARLTETPADPPFPATQTVEIDGQVSELGKLTAQVRYEMRGDNELALRLAFRRTPQAKWKELGQTIALLDGLKGEVSEVTVGDPAATERPFEFRLTLSSPNLIDWARKKSRLLLPLPNVGLPAATEETAEDIELGSPLEVTVRLKLALPANLEPHPPVAMAVARDYAEYRSLYKVENHVFTAERILRFRQRVVPASRAGDYLAFSRAVLSDEAQELALESTAPGKPAIPANAKADELNEAGSAALENGNYAAAAELFSRLTELDPKHKSAWNSLGRAYLGQGKSSEAIAAFRKQIEVNPFDQFAYNNLGLAHLLQRNYEEAAADFRKQIENNPLDKLAHASLGSIYLEQRKYAEAAPELEKATVLNPDNAALQVALGRAYLNLNQNDKALATFDQAVEMAPSPGVWNDIAYELALHNLQLDRAEQYAESAVAATAAALRNVELDRLTLQDLSLVSGLGSFWDTLGWIRFQKGDLDGAEKYIRAAWQLDQVGEVGDHLAQIDEKRGKKSEAIETYALALVASRPAPGTRSRLVALLGGESKVASLENKARNDLSTSRTISLGKLGLGKAEAEFYVVLSSASKVEAVKFIKGSENLRPLADRLRALNYPQIFPDAAPTKLVRRGILSCSSATGECVFVLILPEDVHSVE